MSEEDNKPKRPLNRRSFMATVIGGAAVVGGASTLIAGEAKAQQRRTGRSDSDSGSGADEGGFGRTGVTDSDPYDRPGYGISGTRSGLSDGDPVDPGGNGRGSGGVRTGLTDSDSGSNADQANYGRGAPRG